ncbi:MAG: hypothetical protein HQK96_01510 [Nitrospirae bacterium]|nr:hypothetical protein [Nitrospirota bacterium]
MDERVSEVEDLVKKASSEAIKKATLRMEKRKAKCQRGIRVRTRSEVQTLVSVYSFLYNNKYSNMPPAIGVKELGQFKNLIKKLDADRAEKLVRYVFKNWGFIGMEVGLSGAPLIGDILGRCLRYVEEAVRPKREESDKVREFPIRRV